jgi:hypothetical protein
VFDVIAERAGTRTQDLLIVPSFVNETSDLAVKLGMPKPFPANGLHSECKTEMGLVRSRGARAST